MIYEFKKDDIKPADDGVINAETTATINNHLCNMRATKNYLVSENVTPEK